MMLQWILLNTALIANTPQGVGRLFSYNPEVKASEILTAFSISLSFFTLIITLWQGIMDKRDAEADKVRAAAAKTLSKLERWATLALWHYQDIQPLFVETSDLLAKSFEVAKARDFLWSALAGARIKSSERILAESIETAYVELSSYFPDAYDIFVRTMTAVHAIDDGRHGDLLLFTQANVLSHMGREAHYVPAQLGNELRASCAFVKEHLAQELEIVSAPIKRFLVDVIKSSGSEILARKKRRMNFPDVVDRGFPSLFDEARLGRKVASA